MTKNKINLMVDAYLKKDKKWREELTELRRIILDCQLTEELKWGAPCYTFKNSNVLMIGGFKEDCVLSFFKGALLKNANDILVKRGENTQAARVIRFTSVQEILAMECILKAYIHEAIEIEKTGLKVTFKKISECTLPEELQKKLDEVPALQKAFSALTPGRQRAYLLHFSEPKQSKTRESRIEKCMPKILNGEGLHDEYIQRKK